MDIMIAIDPEEVDKIMEAELSQGIGWMLNDLQVTTNENDRKELEDQINAFKLVLQYYTTE
jgi:hypothetical protein